MLTGGWSPYGAVRDEVFALCLVPPLCWRELPSLDYERWVHGSCCDAGGRVVLVGGNANDSTEVLENGRWRAGPELPNMIQAPAVFAVLPPHQREQIHNACRRADAPFCIDDHTQLCQ